MSFNELQVKEPQKDVEDEVSVNEEDSESSEVKTSPIQGAGVNSFLALSDAALKFWLSVIQSFE